MSDKKITVTTTPKNRIVVNKGGGYSTIDTLVELRDVDAANVKNDDVLVYVSNNGKFVFKEVPFVNSSFQTANAAFDKANAANVLAYTVGINANAWTNTKVSSVTGTSGQIYSSGGTTPTLNLIATGVTARTYGAANQIPVITVDAFGRLTAAANVAVEGMNYVYANSIGAASNAWANTVGTAGNNYSIAIGAASNAWTNNVGSSANSYAGAMANSANARANVVGAASNSWANTVGIAGNNYSIAIGAASNAWANTINVYSDSTYYKKSGGTISGDTTVTGNLTVGKDFRVTGNVYFVDQQTLRIADPLIYLAGNNYTTDLVDIGFVANYVNTTGSNVHTGLYRSFISKQYYLFQEYNKEPDDNYIDYAGNNFTLAALNTNLITSNLILGGANAISWINASFSKANNALANTSGVSFAGDLYFPTGSISIGNVAPSGALHISKAITRQILLNRPEIGTTLTDGAYIGVGGIVADGFGFINQETGPIKFGTSDVERMRITGTGDVGIGTSSPAYTLDVNGVIQAQSTGSASMIINPASGNYAQLLLQNAGTTRWRIRHNDTEDYLSFYDERKTGGAGSQLVIKDTTGHVGLGMTTPNAKFSILSSGIGFAIHDTAGANFLRGLSISTSDASGYSYINAGDGTGWKMFLGTGSASYNSNNIRLAITDNGIGIGTTSPSSKLQVNGTITIANTGPVESFRSGANNITLNMYNEANGTLSWEGSAGQLFSITNDLTGSIFSVNDVSGIPSIDVNANGNISLAQFSGNVGIGTSNPVYKLDVNGDARITGNLTLGDATTDTITVNAANFNLANNVSFDSGTLFIDKNNDRIGIGTTSPAYKLDVNGAIGFNGDIVKTSGDDFRIIVFGRTVIGGGGSGVQTIRSSSGGLNIIHTDTDGTRLFVSDNVGVGTTSPTAKLHVSGGTSTSNTASLVNLTQTWNNSGNTFTAIQTNITDTASASASKLIDLQIAGNTKFKVEKSGDIYIAHSRKIESFPDSYNNYTSIDFGAQGSASMAFYQNGTPATAFRWNDAVPGVRLRSSNSLNWSSTDNAVQTADLAIWRDGSNILAQRFGTSAQTFRLYGTYTDSSNYERLTFFANSTAAYIQTQNGGTGTARPLYLGANNTTAVTIDTAGNVGVGTASPSAKLHVAGDAIFTGNVTVSGNTTYMNTQTLLIGDNLITLNADLPNNLPATEDAGIEVNRGAYGNASIVWDETNDRWDVRANNNTYVTITESGRVGIGTTSPGAPLDISGTTSSVDRTSLILRVPVAAENYSIKNKLAFMSATNIVSSIDAQFPTGASGPPGNLIFNVLSGYPAGNLNEIMRLTGAGNVGIGTTTPTSTLHVVGTANVTGFITGTLKAATQTHKFAYVGDTNLSLGYDDSLSSWVFQGYNAGRLRVTSVTTSTIYSEITDYQINSRKFYLQNVAGASFSGFGGSGASDNRDIILQGGDSAVAPQYAGGQGGNVDIRTGKQTDNTGGNEGTRGFIKFSTYTSGSSPTLTERVRITSAGDVGIGTTSPSEILTVSKSSSGVTVFPHLFLENLDGTDGGVRFYADGDGGGGIITFGSKVSTFAVANGRPSHLTTDHPGRKAGIFNYQNGTTNDASAFLFGNSDAGTNQPIGWKVAITANGRVGVGTTSPNSTLHVVGTANITSGIVTTGDITTTGTMTAQHFDNVSDITLKENIEPIQDALNTLEKLNPVSFTWKKDGSTSFGLIAQEVEKILPEIVHQSDEVKTVSYTQIISLLIAAIKELNTKLDDLT